MRCPNGGREGWKVLEVEELDSILAAVESLGHASLQKTVVRRRRRIPAEVIERVDAAIVSSLQTEVIQKLTVRTLNRQTPKALTSMLMALDDVCLPAKGSAQ